MTTTTQSSRFFESTPSITYENPHEGWVHSLVELEDGSSFLSCSHDSTVKRWSLGVRSDNNRTQHEDLVLLLHHVGTYQGHTRPVMSAAENENNRSFVTSSADGTLKVWDTATCKCLKTIRLTCDAKLLLRSKKSSIIVCGLWNGVIELRKVGDLSIIRNTSQHSAAVLSVCELEDGTFVSASGSDALKRWDSYGTTLTCFKGSSPLFKKVIELKSNIVASVSTNKCLKLWHASKGQCIHTKEGSYSNGLLKLSSSFMCASEYNKMVVMNDRGDPVASYVSDNPIQAMLRLRNGSILFANQNRFEIRRYGSDFAIIVAHGWLEGNVTNH